MSQLLTLNHFNSSSTDLQTEENRITPIQTRLPFADISSHIKHIENISSNIPKNYSKNYFNDHLPTESTYLFLKKKSHGIDINQYEDYSCLKLKEEPVLKENKLPYVKEKKNSLFQFNKNGFNFINNLNEEEEEVNKENFCKINEIWNYNNKKMDKERCFSFEEILKNSIEETNYLKKIERDNKKNSKYKQMKVMLMINNRNKRNSFGSMDFSNNSSNNINNYYYDSNKCVINSKKDIDVKNNEGLQFTFGKNNDSNIIDMNVDE